MKIDDGSGKGYQAKVDSLNRIHTRAQVASENLGAAKDGEAYNIHSGSISFSAAGSLIYLKNNETQDLIIEGLVVALGAGSVSDSPEISIYQDITGGDLLTDETAVTFVANRNYGSSRALVADTYMGKNAGTVTGTGSGLFYFTAASRNFAELNIILPKGSSIGIALDPKLTAGTMKAYAVLITYLSNPAST